MIGNQVDNVLESAVYAGNFDAVKRIIAQSEGTPLISGKVLIKLIDPTLFPELILQYHKSLDILFYLMDNCRWSPVDMELEYQKTDPEKPFLQWLLENNHKGLEAYSILEYYVRWKHKEEEIERAVESGYVDLFSQKFEHHTRSSSYFADTLDYILPEYANNYFRKYLRKKSLTQTSEYLTVQEPDENKLLLIRAIKKASCNNIAMLSRFLTYGVDINVFEAHVDMPLQQWCEQNYCTDLLDNETVKNSLQYQSKVNAVRDIVIKSAHEKLSSYDKDVLMKLIDEDFKVVENGYTLTEEQTLPFYQWAAKQDLTEVLELPDMFPEAVNELSMHHLILECAKRRASRSVKFLIEQANIQCPDALRFSKEEIDAVQAAGCSQLADTLTKAFNPQRPSLLWTSLSYLGQAAMYIANSDDQQFHVQANKPESNRDSNRLFFI